MFTCRTTPPAPFNQIPIRILFIYALLVCSASYVFPQKESSPHLIGINPSVTIEPFYEKGELDVNIIPLVYQRHLSLRLDLRFTTILNLGVRKTGNAISHFGLESAMPVYFVKQELITDCSKGFFIAPVVSLTRNRIEKHTNIGVWAEPGYSLLFDNRCAMSFGLQVGATHFSYDAGADKWGGHFGAKVIFGRWL